MVTDGHGLFQSQRRNATTLFKLIDALDDDDDVQTVYTNADFTDEQLAGWG